MNINKEIALYLSGGTNIKRFLAPIIAPTVNVDKDEGYYNYVSHKVQLPTDTEMTVAPNTRLPSSTLVSTAVKYTTAPKGVAVRMSETQRNKIKENGGTFEAEAQRLLMNEIDSVHAYWEDSLNDLIRVKYAALGHGATQSPTAANQWVKTSTGAGYVETDINTLITNYTATNGYSDGVPTIFGDYKGIDIGIHALVTKYGSESTLEELLRKSLADQFIDVTYMGVRWIGTRATYYDSTTSTYKPIWDAGTNTKQLFFTYTQPNPLQDGAYLSYAFTAVKPHPDAKQVDGALPWLVEEEPNKLSQDDYYWQATTRFGVNTIKDTTIFVLEGPSGSTYDLWA